MSEPFFVERASTDAWVDMNQGRAAEKDAQSGVAGRFSGIDVDTSNWAERDPINPPANWADYKGPDFDRKWIRVESLADLLTSPLLEPV